MVPDGELDPMNRLTRPETARQVEAAVVDMYSRHPSPGRRDKLEYASRRMSLRLRCCGIEPEDYVGRRVLDAGCGTGEYSYWFASQGAHVTGIDLSEGSLREAREFARREGHDLRFEKRSVLDTGYPDGGFDLVYCTGVLHHTVDPPGGFVELCRVLRPGGKILVSLYNSIGFLPRGLRWQIARTIGRGRPDRSTCWGQRLFPLTSRRLTRGDRNDPQAALFDYFGIPRQSRHSAGEVLDWLKRCAIDYRGAFPPLLFSDYPAMFALDELESVEARYRPGWARLIGRLGRGGELRRRPPGPLSRASIQALWLLTGVSIFSVCGQKPGTGRSVGLES